MLNRVTSCTLEDQSFYVVTMTKIKEIARKELPQPYTKTTLITIETIKKPQDNNVFLPEALYWLLSMIVNSVLFSLSTPTYIRSMWVVDQLLVCVCLYHRTDLQLQGQITACVFFKAVKPTYLLTSLTSIKCLYNHTNRKHP